MNISIRTFFLLLFLLLPGGLAHAQFSQSGIENNILISINPSSPLPGEYVSLSASSPVVNLERSEITWYADRKIIAEGTGLVEASVMAGPPGSEVDVVVIAQSEDGASATGEIFIRPAEVDLLWESDSYTPPFYRGRALPSAGTKLRVQAIARLKLQNGNFIPETDIIYTWRRNGSLIKNISGRGRSFATFPSPSLFGTDVIEVEAVSADGTRAGKASVRIPSIEPALFMYENSPLFGILYNRAFDRLTSVKDSEMTFATVPYFAPAKSSDDSQLEYRWKVNGQSITTDYARPNEITINADKSNGVADISLTLTKARNWYMQAGGEWKISFPSSESGFANDPFSAGNQ